MKEGIDDDGASDDVSQVTTTPSTNDKDRGNFEDGLKPSFSQESSSEAVQNAEDASSKYIVNRLKEVYHKHVLKAEKRYHLHFNFCLPTDGEIKDSEFDATPMVLLIGQYSTGKVRWLLCWTFAMAIHVHNVVDSYHASFSPNDKTTFLNHLLREEFPGMHIGPEPTTDKVSCLFFVHYHNQYTNKYGL